MTASDFSLLLDDFIETNEQYQSQSVFNSSEDEIDISTNRLIVVTDNNNPLTDDCNAIDKLEGFNNWHIFQYYSESTASTAYAYFNNQEYVNHVEYDTVFHIDDYNDESESFNDYDFSKEYGAQTVNSSVAINSLNAKKTNLEEIVVAVIDTGVDETHSFFNKNERRILPSDGEYDNSPNTDLKKASHGTHVAGIIVNNTPKNVKIRSINIAVALAEVEPSAYASVLASKIELAVAEQVDVINMSIAFEAKSNNDESVVSTAVNKALSNGIVLVAASGNNNKNANGYLPGCLNSVITVSATDRKNKPWESIIYASNYGDSVDISAPGFEIWSTVLNNNSEKNSGTSMAAPFVSAAAAILKTVIPGITPQQIKDRLKNTAYVPPGWDTNYGAGIVDFKAMLADQMTSPPTINVIGNSATITAESGATIYYTTDKTDPTVESTVYSEPISTANIKELRAIAVKSNLLPSEPTINIFERDIDVNVIVNKTKTIDFPEGMTARYINNKNPEIAILSADGTVEGFETGEATAIVYFGNNHSAVYHIHVDYHPFIKFLRIVFFWLFWIIDLFK